MWYLPMRLRLCDIYLWGLGCVMFTCEVEVVSYLPVRLCDIYLWGWGCVIFTCEVEVVSYLPVRLWLYEVADVWYLPMRLRLCDIYPWGWGRRGVPPALVWCCPTRCGSRVRPGRTVASSSVPAKSLHLSDTDLLDQQLHMSQLRAGGPVIPGLTSSGWSRTRSEHVLGCYGYPGYHGDEYYFYFIGGHTQASLKGGRSCSLGTRNK